jgi:ABC-2 type transport system ATP-binding protein
MIKNALKIQNLSKKFGDFWAVKDLDLEVREGSIFGVLGPNGAGKTTTIKLITGLLKPTRGNIFVGDTEIQENPYEAKKKFSLLPDVPYLYEKLTGWEFMNFIIKIYNLNRTGITDEVDNQLNRFGLLEVAHDLIDSYSHGMRQRLLLASVMLRDPDIIILDEPMVGLDPEAARMVKNIFKELSKKKKTIFLSTHTLSDAQELCSEIAIINRGKLIASGNINELMDMASKISGLKAAGDEEIVSLEDIYLAITKNA